VSETPRGIGGWLILPVLGLILTLPLNLVTFLRNHLPIFTEGYWGALTDPAGAAYHPLWAPLLIFEIGGNVALCAAALVLLRLLFQYSPRFPSGMMLFYAVNVCFLVVDFYLTELIPAVAGQKDEQSTRQVVRAIVSALIWIPYFRHSVRVMATFTDPPDRLTVASERIPAGV
jgi:hypothetical protein